MFQKGDLFRRLGVAAVGIPLALVVLVVGGWVLTILVALLALVATWELNALAQARGVRVFSWLSMAGTLVLVLQAGFFPSFNLWGPWAMGSLLFLFFLSSAAAVRLRAPADRPLVVASLTVTGALYWGGGFSFAIFLRQLPEMVGWTGDTILNPGVVLLAFPLAVTWMADTAAYLVGSQIGRRKLAPTVSPGKTVEGGVAGLSVAVLAGALMGWVFLGLSDEPAVSALLGGCMGFLMGVTVQVGDLIESLYKREAGVKDSGWFLPGHGGILDRFDALIFTLPLTYALVSLVERLQ